MVEGNGLENRQTGNGLVGSNPTLSAKKQDHFFSFGRFFREIKFRTRKQNYFSFEQSPFFLLVASPTFAQIVNNNFGAKSWEWEWAAE